MSGIRTFLKLLSLNFILLLFVVKSHLFHNKIFFFCPKIRDVIRSQMFVEKPKHNNNNNNNKERVQHFEIKIMIWCQKEGIKSIFRT